MAIDFSPLPLSATADASKFGDFGREVRGVHPGKLTPEEFSEIREALYEVRLVRWLVAPGRCPDRPLTTVQCTPIPRCVINPGTTIRSDEGEICHKSIYLKLICNRFVGI
jgi:hypothetical protein